MLHHCKLNATDYMLRTKHYALHHMSQTPYEKLRKAVANQKRQMANAIKKQRLAEKAIEDLGDLGIVYERTVASWWPELNDCGGYEKDLLREIVFDLHGVVSAPIMKKLLAIFIASETDWDELFDWESVFDKTIAK